MYFCEQVGDSSNGRVWLSHKLRYAPLPHGNLLWTCSDQQYNHNCKFQRRQRFAAKHIRHVVAKTCEELDANCSVHHLVSVDCLFVVLRYLQSNRKLICNSDYSKIMVLIFGSHYWWYHFWQTINLFSKRNCDRKCFYNWPQRPLASRPLTHLMGKLWT